MTSAKRVELEFPGLCTRDLRDWASRLVEANEIGPNIDIRITDMQFMGVELTITNGGDIPMLTLALFATTPNEQEREIMETENVWTAGL